VAPGVASHDKECHLRYEDIQLMPSLIRVRIKATKTDPFGTMRGIAFVLNGGTSGFTRCAYRGGKGLEKKVTAT